MLVARRRWQRISRHRRGWLLAAGLVLSLMSGISHTYYVVVLGPPSARSSALAPSSCGRSATPGTDPTPTLAAFEQLVAAHEVHYFVAGGGFGGFASAPTSTPAGSGDGELGDRLGAGGFGGAGGFAHSSRGGSDSGQIMSWVEGHFTAKTVGGTTVYDLTAPAKAA